MDPAIEKPDLTHPITQIERSKKMKANPYSMINCSIPSVRKIGEKILELESKYEKGQLKQWMKEMQKFLDTPIPLD